MQLASAMTGRNVRNEDGEDLGTLDDLLVDTRLGGPAFAVISFGGFLGLGGKSYAVPMEALEPSEDGFVLSLDPERVKTAAPFDAERYADFNDDNTMNAVRDHYIRS